MVYQGISCLIIFINVYHGISCLIIFYQCLSWYIRVYHGLSWYIRVHHGLSWFIRIHHGLSMFIMVYQGLSLFIMTYHDLSMFVMVYHGFNVYHGLSWFVMVYHGLSWFIMVYHHTWSHFYHFVIFDHHFTIPSLAVQDIWNCHVGMLIFRPIWNAAWWRLGKIQCCPQKSAGSMGSTDRILVGPCFTPELAII